MKTLKRFFCVLAILLCGTLGVWAQPAASPAMPASLDEAAIIAVSGDAGGLVVRVGNLVGIFQPGINGDTLRALLGMQLQDPGLSGLQSGAGILVAVYPKSSDVFVFAQIAETQIPTYQNTLNMRGIATAAADGLLVASQNPMTLEAARKMAPQAKQALAKESSAPTVKITVRLARLLNEFRDQITMYQQMMEMMEPSMMNRIALRMLMAGAAEIESLVVELAPSDQGVLLDLAAAPKAGSNLAAFLGAPSVSPAGLIELLPSKGAIRAAAGMNADAYAKFVDQTAGKVFDEMMVAPADRETFLSLMKDSTWSDAMAADMLAPGDALIEGVFVARTKSPEAGLAAYEAMVEKMRNDAIKTAEATGVKMDVQLVKNVRQHGGVAIHQFKMNAAMDAAIPQAAVFQKIMGQLQYDLAFLDTFMVSSMGNQRVEDLIDAVKNKRNPNAKPLVAPSVFGQDAQMYGDLHAAGTIRWGVGLMRQFAPMEAMQIAPLWETAAASLQDAPPVTAAVFMKADAARVKIQVPNGLLVKIGAAIQQAQQQMMQMMMQQGGAGQSESPRY